jgi:hypothetical protein
MHNDLNQFFPYPNSLKRRQAELREQKKKKVFIIYSDKNVYFEKSKFTDDSDSGCKA